VERATAEHAAAERAHVAAAAVAALERRVVAEESAALAGLAAVLEGRGDGRHALSSPARLGARASGRLAARAGASCAAALGLRHRVLVGTQGPARKG